MTQELELLDILAPTCDYRKENSCYAMPCTYCLKNGCDIAVFIFDKWALEETLEVLASIAYLDDWKDAITEPKGSVGSDTFVSGSANPIIFVYIPGEFWWSHKAIQIFV